MAARPRRIGVCCCALEISRWSKPSRAPGARTRFARILSPRGIRTHLSLNKPIYTPTSSYGHFGREPEASGAFSWERTDLADELRRAF